MAELEIDQSHLPRVQEVCQCFAVLEDSVLAHNLQEQEIEHYYTNNIQKNQLVQNDIRMAKRLQDEEQEEREQQRAVLRQASRQLEEQDSEYARIIQEEIQRCAEETLRREQQDEEIAKQIQEQEEQGVRRSSRGQDSLSDDGASGPALPSPHQHAVSNVHRRERQRHPSTATRWQCSTSHAHSDFTGPQIEPPKVIAAQKCTAPWSNEGHANSIRQIRNDSREPLSEDSEDSDTVFSEQPSTRSQRLDKRLAAPCRRQASLHQPPERNYRSLHSGSSFREKHRGWEVDREVWEEGYEYGDLEESRARNKEWERNYREGYEGQRKNRDHNGDRGSAEMRGRQRSRSDSVRLQDRDRHTDLARTWTYRENPDKRVHFQDDNGQRNGYHGNGVWEMLGQVLRERGVAVRHSVRGAPPQPRSQRRDSQALYGSEVSNGDSQSRQRAFQRAASARRSYHGDIRERRTSSYRENGEKEHRGGREWRRDSPATAEDDGVEIYEEPSRDSRLSNGERGGSRRWRTGDLRHGARSSKDDEGEDDVNGHRDGRVRRSTSERRHRHEEMEERLSPEEEVDRGAERRYRRAPQRSQSLRSGGVSTRVNSRRTTAGAAVQPQPSRPCLDLGELHQVLQDEELARRLQEEEERLLRSPQPLPSPQDSYPEGDFRVAQVAQDEEIARFMQKQEIKSKRRSRELEGPGSWREHREMISHHDGRAARERQLPQVQRERLDSEGLPSPTEDYSSENQPPSPISTIQAQQIRNIAEELDPTFQARRQDQESLRVEQTGPACQSLPVHQPGLHDFLEEPTFIPPTKRQSDKSARTKPKEKKENCKQQ